MNLIRTLQPIVKHERMTEEFRSLTPRTRAIVLFTTHLFEERFSYQPIWTEFHRTQDMQSLYYNDQIARGYYVMVEGRKYYSKDKNKPTLSVHQFDRGADLSRQAVKLKGDFGIVVLTDAEINQIVAEVNTVFPYGKEPHSTCVYHEQYGKPHFHFQSPI